MRSNKTHCGEKYNSENKDSAIFFSLDMYCQTWPHYIILCQANIFYEIKWQLSVKFCLYLGHKSPNTTYTYILTVDLEFSNVNIMRRSSYFSSQPF